MMDVALVAALLCRRSLITDRGDVSLCCKDQQKKRAGSAAKTANNEACGGANARDKYSLTFRQRAYLENSS